MAARFQFHLHQVGEIMGGMLILPATPDVIASFIAGADAAPEELSTIANIMPAPAMPFIPAEHHGKLVMMVYAGNVASGRRVVARFRKLAQPVTDLLRPMRVAQLRVLGGVMARVPVDATAFAHRQSRII